MYGVDVPWSGIGHLKSFGKKTIILVVLNAAKSDQLERNER